MHTKDHSCCSHDQHTNSAIVLVLMRTVADVVLFLSVKVSDKKKALAKGVESIFDSHKVVAVLHYNDMTANEWQDLRFDLSQKEARVKLIPTKISLRALDRSVYRNIVVLFSGPTALVYSNHTTAVSGVLAALAGHPKVELLGAVVEQEMVTRRGLQELASLPPLPQVQSQLVGVLSSVPSAVVGILQQAQRRLVTLLEQHYRDRTAS